MPFEKRTAKSIWSIEDGVTQSLLDTFLVCREQCRLKYQLGYRKKTVGKAAVEGSCGHYLLQKFYGRAMMYGKKDVPPERLVRKWALEFGNSYSGIYGNVVVGNQAVIDEAIYTIIKVMPQCFRYWQKDLTRKWVNLEQTFKVPYEYRDGFKTFLRGKFDGVFERKGKLWLQENKFKSQIDYEGISGSLSIDLQTWFYLVALSTLAGKEKKEVGGVVYNVIRRPQLKQKANEKTSEFIERIEQDIIERPEWYFFRMEMEVTTQEVLNWSVLQLGSIMHALRDWCNGKPGSHYATPSALFHRWGRCDLFDILVKGDYSGYITVEKPFSELEEDF